MPTNKVDDLNRSIKESIPLVTSITDAYNKASEILAKFEARITAATTKIDALNARATRNETLARGENIGGHTRERYTKTAEELRSKSAEQSKKVEELKTRKQAVLDLAPDSEVLKAAGAADIYTKSIERLIGKLQVLSTQTGVEDQVKKTEAALKRAYTGLSNNLKVLEDYNKLATESRTSAAAAPVNLTGTEQFSVDVNKAPRMPSPERWNQRQEAFKAASPARREEIYNRDLKRAYEERWALMDAAAKKTDQKRVAEAEKIYPAIKTVTDPKGRWSNAYKIAQEKGYNAGDIVGTRESGLAGVQQATFRTTDAISGVRKELKLFTDDAGKVLPSTSRQFSTFASSVARDFRELAKWTIAIGLIYGPMRKIQELTKLMIDNEVKLADASIAVSDSTLKMGDIFDIAAKAANDMGENISDVIVNFSQAYQATGGLGSALERTAVATKLMNDALILSKLSSLTAAESIDILASALKQSGSSLEGGTHLLDQWVKVSTQAANVSLDTLATGFSVLGEAANAAGLSNEELTAILAVTSEQMGVGGREAANMARAFVVGFQSDKAIAALEGVGIATKTVSGDMRTLLDIQSDLYSAKTSGLLSETTYYKLTTAIGGGARRQAPTAGFIEAEPRIQEIIDAQKDSEGAAAAALAKQLETVQTAMTRLQNGMQSLAQSLGDEGGLLDVFQTILNLLTLIAKAADKAFEAMGKTGPLLAISLGVGALLKSQGPLWKTNLATQLGLAVTGMTGGAGPTGKEVNQQGTFARNVLLGQQTVRTQATLGNQNLHPMFGGAGTPEGFQQVRAKFGSAENLTGIALSATLAAIGPIIQNLKAYSGGTDEFGREKAGAGATGALIGASIGATLGGGPVAGFIGASVGQAIAETFVSVATKDLDLSNIKGGVISRETPTGVEYEETSRTILGGAGTEGGISKQLFAELWAFVSNTVASTMVQGQGGTGFGGPLPEGEEYKFKQLTTEGILYSWLDAEGKKLVDTKAAEDVAAGNIPSSSKIRPVDILQKEQQTDFGSYITTITKQREEEFLDELIKGTITPTAYTGKMDVLSTFTEKASRLMAAYGDELIASSADIDNTKEAYQALLDLVSYGDIEQVNSLTTMTTQVSDLYNEIEALKKLGTPEALALIGGKEKEIAGYKSTLARSTAEMVSRTEFNRYPLPNIMNQGEPATATDAVLKQVIEDTRANQLAFATSPELGDAAKTPAQVSAINEGLDDFALVLNVGGQLVYTSVVELAKKLTESGEKLDPDFFKEAWQAAIDSGQITLEVKIDSPSWGGKLDFPSSAEGQITAWINYAQNMMEKMGITDLKKGDIQVVQYEDGQWGQLRGDSRAVAYAMDMLNETAKKQLEQGMWNIPDGASFWVPITSLWQNRNQFPGEDTIPQTFTDPENTGAVADNTAATLANTAALLAAGIDPLTGKETPEHLDYRRREYEAQGDASKPWDYADFLQRENKPWSYPEFLQKENPSKFDFNLDNFNAEKFVDAIFENMPGFPKSAPEVPDFAEQKGVYADFLERDYNKPLLPKKPYLEYEPIKPVPTEKPIGALLSGAGVFAGADFSTILRELSTGIGMLSRSLALPGSVFTQKGTPELAKDNAKLFGGVYGGMKEQAPAQTKLDIKMDSRVQLIVDGRVLANVVKVYLMSDLLKAQQGHGTFTRKVVISA